MLGPGLLRPDVLSQSLTPTPGRGELRVRPPELPPDSTSIRCTSASVGLLSEARPVATTRAKAAARSSTSAKSLPAIPRSTSSTIALSCSGPWRVGHPATTRATWALRRPASNSARHADRVGVHPRAQEVEPPQAAGQGVRGRPRPHLGDRLDALGVGQVQEPVGDPESPESRAPDQQHRGAVGRLADQRRVGPAQESPKNRPRGHRRWWRRLGHEPGYGAGLRGERTSDALVADGGRAELLGPERDAVLLEHPPHLPQPLPRRPALGQRPTRWR